MKRAGPGECRTGSSNVMVLAGQSMYWSGVTLKSSGSFTPVEWLGQ